MREETRKQPEIACHDMPNNIAMEMRNDRREKGL